MHSFRASKLLEKGEVSPRPSPLNYLANRPSQRPRNPFCNAGEQLLTIGGPAVRIDDEGENFKDETDCTLADIYDCEGLKGKIEVEYEYDFGDGWVHHTVFLGRTEPSGLRALRIPEEHASIHAVCLGGEVSCPSINDYMGLGIS